MPSEKDLKHPNVGKYVEKYLKAAACASADHRMRIGRLIESLTTGVALVESMHGAGSPQAQRIMILRQADLEFKKKLALRLASIEA